MFYSILHLKTIQLSDKNLFIFAQAPYIIPCINGDDIVLYSVVHLPTIYVFDDQLKSYLITLEGPNNALSVINLVLIDLLLNNKVYVIMLCFLKIIFHFRYSYFGL
jgi:hypothetical protein